MIPSTSQLPDLIIWTGPVWDGNIKSVAWSHPTEILTLSCVGSDKCGAIGSNVGSPKLDNLLAAHGTKASNYGKIAMGSFSAGHGLCQILLSDAPSRERLSAFCSFDSYYTGAAPGIKSGYLAFGQSAANGEGRLMWSSSSQFPDRTWLSCEDSIQPLLAKLELTEDVLPADLESKLKPPVYCARRGGFSHANFGTVYAHADHAKIIAPAVFENWISPLMHGQPPSSTMWNIILGAGVALVAGTAAVMGIKAIQRSRS
jgi:hypothetical protein